MVDDLKKRLYDSAIVSLSRREYSRAWLAQKLMAVALKFEAKKAQQEAQQDSNQDSSEDFNAGFNQHSRSQHIAVIDGVLDSLEEGGWLSDKRFAQLTVRGLRRQGRSRFWISTRLHQRGVAKHDIANAFKLEDAEGDEDADADDAELRAITRYIERRGLTNRDFVKAMRALERQGFSTALAHKVLLGGK